MIPHFSSSEKEFSAVGLWRLWPVRSVDPRCTVYVLRAVLSLLHSVRFGQPSVRRKSKVRRSSAIGRKWWSAYSTWRGGARLERLRWSFAKVLILLWLFWGNRRW